MKWTCIHEHNFKVLNQVYCHNYIKLLIWSTTILDIELGSIVVLEFFHYRYSSIIFTWPLCARRYFVTNMNDKPSRWMVKLNSLPNVPQYSLPHYSCYLQPKKITEIDEMSCYCPCGGPKCKIVETRGSSPSHMDTNVVVVISTPPI